MIQKLQNSNLELQERLAVALKVDEAKDNAIVKFHDTWERMVGKVRGLSEAKTELEVQLSRLQSGNSKELDEANQVLCYHHIISIISVSYIFLENRALRGRSVQSLEFSTWQSRETRIF